MGMLGSVTSDLHVFLPLQFSLQIDMIRQKLEFDAQSIRSVMEERFGTSDEVVQRTQVSFKVKFIFTYNKFLKKATHVHEY